MRLTRRQEGYTLILLLGIIAALLILAATLSMVTANAAHFTYDDRLASKSLSVAEAGVDAGLSALSSTWPTTTPSGSLIDTAAFRGNFSASEFPNPSSGSFIGVTVYDNVPGSPVDGIDLTNNYDANGDGRVWLRVKSGVGSKATVIQVEVERVFSTSTIAKGIAAYSASEMDVDGDNHSYPMITMEVPPTQLPAQVIVSGSAGFEKLATRPVTDTTKFVNVYPGMSNPPAQGIPTLSQVMPQATIDMITNLAKANGRYFSGATAIADAQSSPVNSIYSPQGGFSGLCVIQPATVQSVNFGTAGQTMNSATNPGLLMVLGGSNLYPAANTDYYGVLICLATAAQMTGTGWGDTYGGVYLEVGGYPPDGSYLRIHGMIIAAGRICIPDSGQPQIMYNDTVMNHLSLMWPLYTRIVPDTWRQLPPGTQ